MGPANARITHQTTGQTARHERHAEEEHHSRPDGITVVPAPAVSRECLLQVLLVQEGSNEEADYMLANPTA
jgi:hypothetical protein